MTNFQKNLEKDLVSIYRGYEKNPDPSILKDINDAHRHVSYGYVELDKDYPMVEIKIKNNVVTSSEGKDDRLVHTKQLINNTISWCKKNNLKVPNTTLYIWISDRFPWYVSNLDKFPIYVYARPKNIRMPIFPDNTFQCLTLEKKYRGECYDWDQIKDIVKKECKSVPKEKIIYFKGTPTTRSIHRLREKLQEYSKKDQKHLRIMLDAWETYEPIYNFCKYMYLLNLPGHYPWSNRLKYLFLMDSIVINVNVKTINLKPKYEDEPYITFIDYVVDKKDYVEIIYTYYRVDREYKDDKKLSKKVDSLNNSEFKKFTHTLQKLFDDFVKHPKKYEKMVASAKKKVEQLTNENIYAYIYRAILENSKIIT